jgi:enoyl-CoA hydratase
MATPQQVVQTDRQPIPNSEGFAVTITLNRPDDLNALNWETVRALDDAVTAATSDDQVRVIFLTGAGRAFSAGGDLKDYLELQHDVEAFRKYVAELHAAFSRLRTLPVPVVALVNGIAAAGGLELMLNCDIVIAAESAEIGDAHLNYGQMGGGGVLTLLPRMIGISRSCELLFTGKLMPAKVAAEWGLVNEVVSDGRLVEVAVELATQIAQKSPLAVANAKQVMNRIWAESMSVGAGLQIELEANVEYCATSADAHEGLIAFRDKRRPRFVGR